MPESWPAAFHDGQPATADPQLELPTQLHRQHPDIALRKHPPDPEQPIGEHQPIQHPVWPESELHNKPIPNPADASSATKRHEQRSVNTDCFSIDYTACATARPKQRLAWRYLESRQ